MKSSQKKCGPLQGDAPVEPLLPLVPLVPLDALALLDPEVPVVLPLELEAEALVPVVELALEAPCPLVEEALVEGPLDEPPGTWVPLQPANKIAALTNHAFRIDRIVARFAKKLHASLEARRPQVRPPERCATRRLDTRSRGEPGGREMDGLHVLKSFYSMPHLFVGGRPAERAGVSRLASERIGARASVRLEVGSPEFSEGSPIPIEHTADGIGTSPALSWGVPPPATRSLVLLCEDPDAPLLLPFVHWLLYDLPPELLGIPAALHGGAPDVLCGGHVGWSSMLKTGWAGCAPPKGDTAHHYHFQLFALDRVLAIEPGAGRSRVLEGTRDHVIGFGELVGTYQR